MRALERDGGVRDQGRRAADAGSADASAAASSRVQLAMSTRSSLELKAVRASSRPIRSTSTVFRSWCRTAASRASGSAHHTLEGDVSLGVASGEDAIVFVFDRVATAWSPTKEDESGRWSSRSRATSRRRRSGEEARSRARSVVATTAASTSRSRMG